MDSEKGESGGSNNTEKTLSQGQAEALKKCLEENKGEGRDNCKSKVEAFQSSSPARPKKSLGPLRLRSGSLTDV